MDDRSMFEATRSCLRLRFRFVAILAAVTVLTNAAVTIARNAAQQVENQACGLVAKEKEGLVSHANNANQVQGNLVCNASFELGEKGPMKWSINHRGSDGEIVWDTSRSHTGRASMRLMNRTKAQTGNVLHTIRLDPPLEPGSRVSFSALAACEDVVGRGPRIVFNLFSISDARQDASADCQPGMHDFVEVSGEAMAVRRTDRLVIYL